jgi:uncharacterized protein (TIGR02284 family)
MATTKGMENDVIELLTSLIELDYDAIEAYKAAIQRMDELSDRSQLASFLEDHQRHVTDLGEVVVELGGTPPAGGDMKQILTKGKVVLAGLAGDRVVLEAMKTNETDTNTAYERAANRADLPSNARIIIEKNLDDERRHKAWIEERIRGSEGMLDLHKKSA